MDHLSHDRIQAIYTAAIATGLASQQEALFAGLPAAYTATLLSSGPHAARLLHTLHAMNAVPALVDGRVPLSVWLRNAAALASALPEGRVFQAALAEIRGALPPVKSSAAPPVLPVSPVSPAPVAMGSGPGVASSNAVNVTLGRPARIFISYAHVDEAHRQRLDVHLSPLKRQKLIAPWHDRMIQPGTEWATEIDRNLLEADVVLLLVSADFVASDYCFEKEMMLALDRHEKGAARVIPIIVAPVDFKDTPFARLQALPRDAKPVSTWKNSDEAWLDIARGIRRVIEALGAR